MADTGFLFPTSVVQGALGHRVDWVDLANIMANDGNVASVSITSDLQGSEIAAGFDFGVSLPDGSTIDGFEVKIEYTGDTAHGNGDLRVAKVEDAEPSVGPGFLGGNGLTTDVEGSPTELWGDTWTKEEAEAAYVTFGCFANTATMNFSINYIQIKVYYTAPVGEPDLFVIHGYGAC